MSELLPTIAAPLGDIETERLTLGRFKPSDLDELTTVFSQPEVWWFPFGRPFRPDETQAFLDRQVKAWDERGFGLWAARPLHTGRLIGFIGLSVPTFLSEILPAVEVGWRLAPTAWGHGYATEGATAALHEAFNTLRLSHVCSLPHRENHRSVAVAERLGMKRVRPVTIPATDRRGEVEAILFEVQRAGWTGTDLDP